MAFWLYRNKTHPAQQPSPEWQRCPWNCWRSRCTARHPVQWGCPGWDSSFLLCLLRWCGEGRPPKEAHLYRWTPSGKELSGKEHWIVYLVTPRVTPTFEPADHWFWWPCDFAGEFDRLSGLCCAVGQQRLERRWACWITEIEKFSQRVFLQIIWKKHKCISQGNTCCWSAGQNAAGVPSGPSAKRVWPGRSGPAACTFSGSLCAHATIPTTSLLHQQNPSPPRRSAGCVLTGGSWWTRRQEHS